jgi:hypothetical protein
VFLGWSTVGRRDYYVRQLRDMKGRLEVETFTRTELHHYAKLCGWTLARAHARSGDASAIAGYLGKGTACDRAMAGFASAYADQVEKDFKRFLRSVKDGQIPAERGV